MVETVVFHRRSGYRTCIRGGQTQPSWSSLHITVALMRSKWDVARSQRLVTMRSCTSTLPIPGHLHTQRYLSMMRRCIAVLSWYSSCREYGAEPDITGVTEIALGREARMTRDFRIPSAAAHPGL
jgi:hypothetical protein